MPDTDFPVFSSQVFQNICTGLQQVSRPTIRLFREYCNESDNLIIYKITTRNYHDIETVKIGSQDQAFRHNTSCRR